MILGSLNLWYTEFCAAVNSGLCVSFTFDVVQHMENLRAHHVYLLFAFFQVSLPNCYSLSSRSLYSHSAFHILGNYILRSVQQGGGLTSNLPTIQADEKLPFYGGHKGFGKWNVNIGEG